MITQSSLMYKISEGDKEAIIFLEKEDLYGDVNTIRQIREMITDPSVDNPRIMPDCHYSNSCCVGFTSRVTGKTVPRFIGGDIGCGMTAIPLPPNCAKKIYKNTEKYHDFILMAVPTEKRTAPVTRDLQPIFDQCNQYTIPGLPTYNEEWFVSMCGKVNIEPGYVLNQLGTLGGGNHFIEIGVDENDQMYLSIHSGSRGLGQAICRYHQDIITKGTKKDWDGYHRDLKKLTRKKKDRVNQQEIEAMLAEKYLTDRHPRYLEGEEANQYFYDMIFAQEYARYNRYLMIREIFRVFGCEDPVLETIIESIHNYIDFEDGIWRKGAIRADEGRVLIIALNMRDGILLAKGKGNSEWNNSAPHGAGRKVPRNQANRVTNMKQFQKDMKDVFSRSITTSTLDESPVMYKNIDLIREKATDTCEFVHHIKPVINVKGF